MVAFTALVTVVAGVALVLLDGDDEEPASSTTRRPDLPAFVVGARKQALVPAFERAARREGLPVALLEALAWRESEWNADIVNPQSGAIGIGQLLPETARYVARELLDDPSLDPRDPEDNILMTAAYLRALIERFDGDTSRGLAAYLQGSTSVASDGISPQTAQYLEQIEDLRKQFAAARAATTTTSTGDVTDE